MASASPADDLGFMKLAVTTAALEGDAGAMYELVSEMMGDGVGLDRIISDILGPIQVDVGKRWQYGDYHISQEHAATGAMESVLALLSATFEPFEGASHVSVACAEDDVHSLPARMVASLLQYEGFRVTYLGASVPAEDLVEFLRDEGPDSLALSCALSFNLPGARNSIRAAHRANVPVIAGGRGFGVGGKWADAVGADAYSSAASDVGRIVESWEPDILSAETRALDPSDELLAVQRKRASVVGRASEVLLDNVPELNAARGGMELTMLCRALEAAMTVNDFELLGDFATWQRQTLEAQGFEPGIGAVLIEALKTGVGDLAPGGVVALDDVNPGESP